MGTGFADHFSGVAGRYAAFRPEYPDLLFEWLAGQMQQRECAWDCASGNGQAAAGLAPWFAEVIATDASAEQIRNAVQRPNIRYAVASAEQSGLDPSSVDLVTVAQAVHWFDLERFYTEVRRVLKPGGILALWCYGLMRFADTRVDQLFLDFYGNVVGPWWPPQRRFIEEEYRTVPFPFHEISAPPFEIQAEFTTERLAGYLRTWSATQGFQKAHGVDPVTEFERRLGLLVPTGSKLDLAGWPLAMRVARL